MWFWELFAKLFLALIYKAESHYQDDGITYVLVSRFCRKGMRGQTWGRVVFIRKDLKDDKVLKKHEVVHVRQWYKHGFWYPFVYGKETIRAGWVNGWEHAYKLNRFEIEARDLSKY